MLNFRIIATGYNCREYVEKCLQSVVNQSYPYWSMYVIDDGSTDRTEKEILRVANQLNDNRIFYALYHENKGAACRRDSVARNMLHDDVILLLGLDDELLPGCLDRIKQEYDAGKWMTYGNWINQHGGTLPEGFLHFDEATHQNREYRKVKYRSTAPNTFYQWLYSLIPPEDLKINGKWIDSTTESEVMFSCLEMCGKDRIGVIEEPIYLYNENRSGGSLKRLGAAYKYSLYNQVINRPKRNQVIL